MNGLTLQLWALAGAAPDASTTRHVLNLLASRPLPDLVELLLEHPDLGPAAGSLPAAATPDGNPAGAALLAVALTSDATALELLGAALLDRDPASAAYVTSRQDLLAVGVVVNPHVPESLLLRALWRLDLGVRGTQVRRALLQNWARVGARPPASMLTMAVHGNKNLPVDGLLLLGHDPTAIEALTAESFADDLRAIRAATGYAIAAGEHGQTAPDAVVRWLLAFPDLPCTGPLLCHIARRRRHLLADPAVLTAIVAALTARQLTTDEAILLTDAAAGVLGPDRWAEVVAATPALANRPAVGAVDASPAQVLTALQGCPPQAWAALATLLHQQPAEEVTLHALVTAARTAAV